jgi:hypothetical protein
MGADPAPGDRAVEAAGSTWFRTWTWRTVIATWLALPVLAVAIVVSSAMTDTLQVSVPCSQYTAGSYLGMVAWSLAILLGMASLLMIAGCLYTKTRFSGLSSLGVVSLTLAYPMLLWALFGFVAVGDHGVAVCSSGNV